MNRAATAGKREAWQRRLTRYGASRLSVAEFCRRDCVSVQSFYYWKRRLGPLSFAGQQAAFVPVHIAPAPSSSLEIELPNQAIVRVPAEIARERLAEIIQAAGAATLPSATASPEGLRRC
jgi:hypothetical protein